jgi:hypothetical protein
MLQDIHRYPHSPVIELRYALVIFTAFWPVWLWYGSIWTMRAAMLFYWVLLGYVLAEARKPLAKVLAADSETVR